MLLTSKYKHTCSSIRIMSRLETCLGLFLKVCLHRKITLTLIDNPTFTPSISEILLIKTSSTFEEDNFFYRIKKIKCFFGTFEKK